MKMFVSLQWVELQKACFDLEGHLSNVCQSDKDASHDIDRMLFITKCTTYIDLSKDGVQWIL